MVHFPYIFWIRKFRKYQRSRGIACRYYVVVSMCVVFPHLQFNVVFTKLQPVRRGYYCSCLNVTLKKKSAHKKLVLVT